jgi:hypothetical protein
MEQTISPQQNSINHELEIPKTVIPVLDRTRKWANFLAIVGFIFSGLILLMAIGIGFIFSKLPGMEQLPFMPGFIGIFYVIIGVINFIAALFLFRFAVNLKNAIKGKDENKFLPAFNNLDKLFQLIGVLTIIMLALYVLVILIAMFTAIGAALLS